MFHVQCEFNQITFMFCVNMTTPRPKNCVWEKSFNYSKMRWKKNNLKKQRNIFSIFLPSFKKGLKINLFLCFPLFSQETFAPKNDGLDKNFIAKYFCGLFSCRFGSHKLSFNSRPSSALFWLLLAHCFFTDVQENHWNFIAFRLQYESKWRLHKSPTRGILQFFFEEISNQSRNFMFKYLWANPLNKILNFMKFVQNKINFTREHWDRVSSCKKTTI